jgi:hypothetical protein
LTRGFKCDELRKGTWSRRTAKGAILEICITLRMVVMFMLGRHPTGVGRTELQQERSATRGHESHGDIGTEDECGQQREGQYIRSSGVTVPGLHAEGASMPELAPLFQSAVTFRIIKPAVSHYYLPPRGPPKLPRYRISPAKGAGFIAMNNVIMRPRAKPTIVPAATPRQSIFRSPYVISHLQRLPLLYYRSTANHHNHRPPASS